AAAVLEEVPHLQPQRADAQEVRGAHGRQGVQRVAPEPPAEAAGRGVRRRHGQDGRGSQPQGAAAPLGRGGAAAGPPSRPASAGLHRGRRAPEAVPARQACQRLRAEPLLPQRVPAVDRRLRERRRRLPGQALPTAEAPQLPGPAST
ncbi:unnamed protein product, partial [Symbiodinium pilosum]